MDRVMQPQADHFSVVQLVPQPSMECEVAVGLALIQTSFVFSWKLQFENTGLHAGTTWARKSIRHSPKMRHFQAQHTQVIWKPKKRNPKSQLARYHSVKQWEIIVNNDFLFFLRPIYQETPYEQLLCTLLKNNGFPNLPIFGRENLKEGKNVSKITFKIGLHMKNIGIYVFSSLKGQFLYFH